MINFPDIDPVIIKFGPLGISWYSLAYIAGILFAISYSKKISKKFALSIKEQEIDSFATWVIIAIIIGGRLGYVLIYDLDRYISYPLDILKTYEGGMSFHGAFLGVVIVSIIFSKNHRISTFVIFDLVCATSPVGIFLGRIANFINAELFGRVTDMKWGVIFPNGGHLPRHPSQIYESLTEGLLTFLIIQYCIFHFKILKTPGRTSGLFLFLYSIFRTIIENFREPDYSLGFFFDSFTMGQILSFPMFVASIYLLFRKI
jgi:phosphatidylglycerol:prolipoprotein diacylglycerol transferase